MKGNRPGSQYSLVRWHAYQVKPVDSSHNNLLSCADHQLYGDPTGVVGDSEKPIRLRWVAALQYVIVCRGLMASCRRCKCFDTAWNEVVDNTILPGLPLVPG